MLGVALSTCLAFTTLPAARADVVHLANGDRLTGQVVRLGDGELRLATDYAGELRIDWAQVTALTTDGAVVVELGDGRRLRGVVAAPGEGTPAGELELRLAPAAGEGTDDAETARATAVFEPVAVPLTDVVALNPPQVPVVSWSGSVSASVTSTSGNTNSERTYVAGETVRRSDPHRLTVGADLNEASENGVDTVSRTHAYARYDRFFGRRWYLDANASVTEDEFQDLDLRTTAGLAAGHQLSDNDTLRLAAELGLSYVDDDFRHAGDDTYAAGRWSLDLSRHFDGGVELFHVQELLWSLEDGDDRLLRTRTGVRFSLWRTFVATAQLNYDRDETPSPGREKSDRAWLLNLGYTW